MRGACERPWGGRQGGGNGGVALPRNAVTQALNGPFQL